MERLFLTIIGFFFYSQIIMAQFSVEGVMPYLKNRGNNYNPQTDIWGGLWIAVPETDRQEYGVYYFRKEFEVKDVPNEYKIYVTADNRYKLYVNGSLVSVGPARSDITHWKVSAIDIASYLKAGKNVVAAQVSNYGKERPLAMFSVGTGLLIRGEGEASVLNTDDSWLCIKDLAFSPNAVHLPMLAYYAAGPGEIIDMAKTIKGWKDADCDTRSWKNAIGVELATPHDTDYGTGIYEHLLVSNNLPEMERTPERLVEVRKVTGNKELSIPQEWPAKKKSITIPAHSDVTVLLDQQHLTNAYMNMAWSKGCGATLTITYLESLYSKPKRLQKKHRDLVEGMFVVGRTDSITSDGSMNQCFESQEWRTYRYVNLHIVTNDEPLVLNDVYGIFTGYPFVLKSSIETSDTELKKMLEIGWRTQRLCTYETYMDCPYYEQLQYLGDTRIQALITLFNTGDDTMVRNFLIQSDQSRNAEGCTQARYPSAGSAYIAPYALSYIYALHDYMMYCKDTDFLLQLLPGAEAIMNYFKSYQQKDGRLYQLPSWNFSDWVYVDGWQMGVAQRGSDKCSSLMDLQLLMALNAMAEIEKQLGNDCQSRNYLDRAKMLKQAIQQAYWNENRGLYADASDHKYYSQHAGALAILAGMIDGDAAKTMAQKLLTDKTMASCSLYYKFYLHAACIAAGLGDDYLSWLDIWRESMRQGLTTWPETSNLFGTRSDCHAWGASPNIEIYRTVLGIDSDAPGFAVIKIEPHLGTLTQVAGNIPHSNGTVSASYQKKGKKWNVEINIPKDTKAYLIWEGEHIDLHSGKNTMTF